LGPFFGDAHGGWGFNTSDWYKRVKFTGFNDNEIHYADFGLSPSDITDQSVPTAALAIKPFFGKFQKTDTRYTDSNGGHYDGAALLTVPGDPNGIAQGSYFPTVAKLLGEAIPALSYAVGRNDIISLDGTNQKNNFDLNAPFTSGGNGGFESGWPASRPNSNWRHSDFQDVAYAYTYSLFDNIATTGVLK